MSPGDPKLRSKIFHELETSFCGRDGASIDLCFELFYEVPPDQPARPYITNSRHALIAAMASALEKNLKIEQLRLNGSVLSPPEFNQMMATAQWFQQEWARRRTFESSI